MWLETDVKTGINYFIFKQSITFPDKSHFYSSKAKVLSITI